MTPDRYQGHIQGQWILILTVSAMAALAGGIGAVVPALWHAAPSNQRVELASPVSPSQSDNARRLADVLDEVHALKTKLAQDEERIGQSRTETETSCQVRAATPKYSKRPTSRKKNQVQNSRVRPDKLGPSVKEMKELSQYARDVATTVGALDKVLSDPQLLEKRAADLKNGMSRH